MHSLDNTISSFQLFLKIYFHSSNIVFDFEKFVIFIVTPGMLSLLLYVFVYFDF